jgi:glycosyltransferase involved in cell wall biosynthesis
MRVVLADPPAYTPPYDHQLAAALARAGLDVELVTAPFRFGARPVPDGYALHESFYRRSSRIGPTPPRLAVKALEHVPAMRGLLRREADVLHFQWLAAPELDRLLLGTSTPLVFTAHDLLPRRTARRTRLWRALFARFERIVVHSDHGRGTLVDFGVPADRLRVIPHPVFRSDPPRADNGHTVLALGVRAEWRLGYLDTAEIERALSEATVAVFPYRAELDQSGALLQALGAGVPAVVYDVGGLGEVVERFAAGRVVRAGDVDALEAALRELLNDRAELAAARAGAERARETLTWDAAAGAHVDLYRELV